MKTKNKQALYTNKEIDAILDKIIKGAVDPKSLGQVQAAQPQTLDDLLAQIFGEEGYAYAGYDDDEDYYYKDEYDDYDDCTGDCEHCPHNTTGNDSNALAQILNTDHIEDDFLFDDAPLYVLDFRGEHMNYVGAAENREASQRLIKIAEQFTYRQIRVVKITTIASLAGGCLRVHFNTDDPDNDYLYIMMSPGSVLTFGPDARDFSRVAIAFHQECDGLSAHQYDI